ncbi:MAG: prolyl aminopeptidase [Thauera sp.]|nr:prolyl aminopeptidase [Thauera sp.]
MLPHTSLFPPSPPLAHGLLEVGDGHRVYFERCGNPDGLPVLFLHGGPGSGCNARQRQLFDPARFHVVLFDQRGCGRSTPRGDCHANTTRELVEDIERLRLHLGIARWLVFGGSWGAALAVAWCSAHPQACLGAILRGSFLTGQADLDWFFGPEGAGAICADAWSALCAAVPEAAEGRALAALCARLGAPHDLGAALVAAQAWAAWEEALIAPGRTPTAPPARNAAEQAALIDKYRVQAHYLVHRCFLGEETVLEAASRMAGIPTAIIHGRLDLVCRARNALRLHEALPGSRLALVDGAGHSPFDPPLTVALLDALAHFATHRSFERWPAR